MTNFSSFFPVVGAGGGGGFTKMNKYSTSRALDDATHKQAPNLSGITNQNKTTGATTMQFQGGSIGSSSTNSFTNVTNSMAGYKFTHNSTEHTITANAAFNYGYDVVFTFTPGLTANLNYNTTINFTTPLLTVNPATDLGLEDGASFGFLMVSGGYVQYGNYGYGSKGGMVLTGTRIITSASTDLVLTIGIGGIGQGTNPKYIDQPTQSTISGGITLTTADGTNAMGFGGKNNYTSGSQGFNNYGNGGGSTTLSHGFGTGGLQIRENQYDYGYGSDGAILLYY